MRGGRQACRLGGPGLPLAQALGHNVAIGSPPQQRFFGTVLPDTEPRYLFRRNLLYREHDDDSTLDAIAQKKCMKIRHSSVVEVLERGLPLCTAQMTEW